MPRLDAPEGGSVTATITGPLPAGTNMLGAVQIADGTTPTQKLAVSAGGVASVAVASALPAGAALIGNVGVAQASTTAGQSGPLAQGAVTTAAPAYTTAQTSPLSMNTSGGLRTVLMSQSGATTATITAAGALLMGGTRASTPGVIANAASATVSIDSSASVYVNTEGRQTTYSASTTITLAATPTDVFTIYGSASKTVRIRRFEVSGLATVAGGLTATLTKRSAVNTGGTSGAVTAVPYDSANTAATATVLAYTANPTTGTAVGAITTFNLSFPLLAAPVGIIAFNYGPLGGNQSVVLNGVAQGLALNFGGGTVPTTGTIQVTVVWIEES